MDPNAALGAFRLAVQKFDAAPNDEIRAIYATVALDLMRDLDEWLSRGGFLPANWQTTKSIRDCERP